MEGLKSIVRIILHRQINEKTAKSGIHAKRLQAAWNNDYLLSVLQC